VRAYAQEKAPVPLLELPVRTSPAVRPVVGLGVAVRTLPAAEHQVHCPTGRAGPPQEDR
jgi:hypothetical protein